MISYRYIPNEIKVRRFSYFVEFVLTILLSISTTFSRRSVWIWLMEIYLHLRMVGSNAKSYQTKRYRQMLIHIHDWILNFGHDLVRCVESSRSWPNDSHPKWSTIVSSGLLSMFAGSICKRSWSSDQTYALLWRVRTPCANPRTRDPVHFLSLSNVIWKPSEIFIALSDNAVLRKVIVCCCVNEACI